VEKPDLNAVAVMRLRMVVLHVDTAEMEDDRTWKDKLMDKIYQLLFDWDCSPGWYRFAHYVELFIMDAFLPSIHRGSSPDLTD